MEIVGTRRSDFNGKMHQNRFRLGLYPTPLGAYGASTLPPSALVSAPVAPRPLAPHAFGVRLSCN